MLKSTSIGKKNRDKNIKKQFQEFLYKGIFENNEIFDYLFEKKLNLDDISKLSIKEKTNILKILFDEDNNDINEDFIQTDISKYEEEIINSYNSKIKAGTINRSTINRSLINRSLINRSSIIGNISSCHIEHPKPRELVNVREYITYLYNEIKKRKPDSIAIYKRIKIADTTYCLKILYKNRQNNGDICLIIIYRGNSCNDEMIHITLYEKGCIHITFIYEEQGYRLYQTENPNYLNGLDDIYKFIMNVSVNVFKSPTIQDDFWCRTSNNNWRELIDYDNHHIRRENKTKFEGDLYILGLMILELGNLFQPQVSL